MEFNASSAQCIQICGECYNTKEL